VSFFSDITQSNDSYFHMDPPLQNYGIVKYRISFSCIYEKFKSNGLPKIGCQNHFVEVSK
ncbi:MAG: hypothetical protein ACJ8MO_18310, partial [Bacillus sp. (in: firmicutes)]